MAFFTNIKNKTPLGIYVHVPFCRSKCQYCDFYSIPSRDNELLEKYIDAICDHIRETGALAPGYKVDTIYFGGGTPSYLGADALATILTVIRRSFDVDINAEITFEANPDSVSDTLLKRMRSEGFNRISLGVQNDNDELLKKLGRPHDYAQVVNAVQRIRKAGYKNLSLDLMYGLPGQSLNAWKDTLERVMTLAPDHISCYALKIEEGTPMYEYRDHLSIPDEDTQADMYLSAVEILKGKGFRQYEISNFSKKGLYSRQNMKYWTGGEYLGFGPGASSDFAGKRFTIIRDLNKYCEGIKTGGEVLSEMEQIQTRERAGEYLMLRLRTMTGIAREEYERSFLLSFDPIEEYLEKARTYGHAVQSDEDRWRLTPKGFLISNSIISDLLLLQDESAQLALVRK